MVANSRLLSHREPSQSFVELVEIYYLGFMYVYELLYFLVYCTLQIFAKTSPI